MEECLEGGKQKSFQGSLFTIKIFFWFVTWDGE